MTTRLLHYMKSDLDSEYLVIVQVDNGEASGIAWDEVLNAHRKPGFRLVGSHDIEENVNPLPIETTFTKDE